MPQVWEPRPPLLQRFVALKLLLTLLNVLKLTYLQVHTWIMLSSE